MSLKAAPILTYHSYNTPARPAKFLFHGETADQYSAKYLALFLINLGVEYHMNKSPDNKWKFSIDATEGEVPVIKRLLDTSPGASGTIAGSRPSGHESVTPVFFSESEVGRLHLSHSQSFIAQVTSHSDTCYLADIWNAFAPYCPPEPVEITPAPMPVPSAPIAWFA